MTQHVQEKSIVLNLGLDSRIKGFTSSSPHLHFPRARVSLPAPTFAQSSAFGGLLLFFHPLYVQAMCASLFSRIQVSVCDLIVLPPYQCTLIIDAFVDYIMSNLDCLLKDTSEVLPNSCTLACFSADMLGLVQGLLNSRFPNDFYSDVRTNRS